MCYLYGRGLSRISGDFYSASFASLYDEPPRSKPFQQIPLVDVEVPQFGDSPNGDSIRSNFSQRRNEGIPTQSVFSRRDPPSWTPIGRLIASQRSFSSVSQNACEGTDLFVSRQCNVVRASVAAPDPLQHKSQQRQSVLSW
jgi:hypothetical protein